VNTTEPEADVVNVENINFVWVTSLYCQVFNSICSRCLYMDEKDQLSSAIKPNQ